ncbi:hypothetical protein HHI36_013079 [Cryptolaemus montrouzieri]|uniref:Chitin-binding type-2 domain-containing protein n=1 Tax=Cryptolaemus montrouzieri TaxID=559131 RepID=A0ABD2NGT4_9CUCU
MANAEQRDRKDNEDQDVQEDDDLTREEQNYPNHYTDNLPGAPELDYPIFTSIPQTGFSCEGKINWQYYADIETDCQVFHVCESQFSKTSFLCPEGTIFNQKHLVCDWWYNVDCTVAVDLYTLSNGFNGQDLSDEQQFENREGFDLNLASSGGNKAPETDTEADRKSAREENVSRGRGKPNTKQRE